MVSTNITLKNRSSLTLADFKGVDFTSSPHRVAANRAVELSNLIYENGMNQKRKGWRQKYDFYASDFKPLPINGIFHFKNEEKDVLLVIAGTHVVEQGDDRREVGAFTSDGKARCRFFMNQGRCYILNGTQILVYGKWEDGEYRAIDLLSVSDLYVPTTTVSIGSYLSNDTQIALLESPNLLTRRRKNGLHTDSQSGIYTLDSPIEPESEVRIEVTEYYTSGNTKFIELYNGVHGEGIDPRSDVTAREGAVYLIDQEQMIVGELTWGAYSTDEYGITKRENGTITFYSGFIPPSNGEDNATVEFVAASSVQAEAITPAHGGGSTLFGTEGNTNRLFLADSNLIRYSAYEDFSYFPENNYLTVGSDDVPINGFVRLNDSTMAVLKPKSEFDATIFYLTGTLRNQYDSEGNLVSGSAVFTVSSGGVGEGNVNAYTAANLAGDALLVSPKGVYGITLTQNVTTNERNVKERSYSVNERLRLHDLSGAVGIVYENRYYLSVDGVCFIADAAHRFNRDGNALDQSYNYEWWYWENVPARVWAEIDDVLWFGTEEGTVCAFDSEEYEDERFFDMQAGDLTLLGPTFSFNRELQERIGEEDRIACRMESGFLLVSVGSEIVGQQDAEGYYLAEESVIDRIYEGMELVGGGYGSDGFVGTSVTVTEIDRAGCRFRLEGVPTVYDGERFHLYRNLNGKRLIVTQVQSQSFRVKETQDGALLDFETFGEELRGTVYHYDAVAARWVTPYFDGGNGMYGKTLLRMTVTPGIGSGHFRYGYETKRASELRSVQGIDALRFDRFSFTDFSFDNEFASSHTVRKNIRNFNYIRFVFQSNEASAFSVESLTVLYKINKMNRGVR